MSDADATWVPGVPGAAAALRARQLSGRDARRLRRSAADAESDRGRRLDPHAGRSPRESVEEKGRRYLTEGRLVVDGVIDDEVRARCRGRADYVLRLAGGHWSCSCPASSRCAHLVALELVVVGGRRFA